VGCYDPLSIEKIGPEKQWPDAQDRIWAGFGSIEGPDAEAVASWDGRAVTLWGQEAGLGTADCMAMHRHGSGDLWLGDWLGLVRYDGQTFQRLGPEHGFSEERVYSLAEDDEGILYIGHGDATMLYITAYDGAQFNQVLKLERMGNTYIAAILKRSDGDLWFGVGGLGRQRAHRGVGQYNPTKGLVFHGVDADLPDSRIEDLCEDQNGGLWIATVAGLSLFDGNTMHTFTTEQGLPNNHIQCLFQDDQGHLWIGSQAGVSRYDGKVFQTIYSAHIGSTYKIIADQNGGMWFATHDGLVGYRPQPIPPRIHILQTIADEVYTNTASVELFTSTKQVVFEYKGLSSRTRPQHMLYTCRLHGYEEDWHAGDKVIARLLSRPTSG
jgi:ligand-binding sensor domain-containing protein